MSFFFMKNSVKRLFKIIGQADGAITTNGRKGPASLLVLSVA